MENFKRFIKNFGFNKETVIPLVLAVVFTLPLFNHYFITVEWLIIGLFFSIILLFIMMKAGYTIMKSLVQVSAGFTILFFLAQTYCALPTATQSGINDLKNLFGIGILCLLFDFFKSMYKALVTDWKDIRGEKWSWEGAVVMILILIFTILLIYSIYEVMTPILYSLCVYK